MAMDMLSGKLVDAASIPLSAYQTAWLVRITSNTH
jgi:hypothetical protein